MANLLMHIFIRLFPQTDSVAERILSISIMWRDEDYGYLYHTTPDSPLRKK